MLRCRNKREKVEKCGRVPNFFHPSLVENRPLRYLFAMNLISFSSMINSVGLCRSIIMIMFYRKGPIPKRIFL